MKRTLVICGVKADGAPPGAGTTAARKGASKGACERALDVHDVSKNQVPFAPSWRKERSAAFSARGRNLPKKDAVTADSGGRFG